MFCSKYSCALQLLYLTPTPNKTNSREIKGGMECAFLSEMCSDVDTERGIAF